MPILYFVHHRKEYLLQGEAFDFLKHLYATRRASAIFPRLHFRVPADFDPRIAVGHGFGDPETRNRLRDESIRINAMVELCDANYKSYQRKYEKLHRSPAATVWAKKYLTKTKKKMSEPVKRDNTVYFKAENGEDERFDLDAEDLEGEEIDLAPIRWRRDEDFDDGASGDSGLRYNDTE